MYYVVPSVPERDSNKLNNGENVARGVFCTLGLIPYHGIGGGNRIRGRTERLARNVEGGRINANDDVANVRLRGSPFWSHRL